MLALRSLLKTATPAFARNMLGAVADWVLRLGLARADIGPVDVWYSSAGFLGLVRDATAVLAGSRPGSSLPPFRVVEVDGRLGTHVDVDRRTLYVSVLQYQVSAAFLAALLEFAGALVEPDATGADAAARVIVLLQKLDGLTDAQRIHLLGWMDAERYLSLHQAARASR